MFVFVLWSLISLDLSFVPGNKQGSVCILLQADIYFNQHHCWRFIHFSSVCDYDFFIRNQAFIDVLIYIWVFIWIPLISISLLCQYHAVFITITLRYNLKLGMAITSMSSFIIQSSFCYPRIFGLLYEVENCLFKVWKKMC